MDGRPNIVIATSALAIIGGIVAIASFVCGFYDHTDNLFGSMGLGLLITVLFFAEAGFLYSDGKGNHYSFLFMSFANAIAIIAGIYFEAIILLFCVALVILAILTIILGSGKATEKWMALDRI